MPVQKGTPAAVCPADGLLGQMHMAQHHLPHGCVPVPGQGIGGDVAPVGMDVPESGLHQQALPGGPGGDSQTVRVRVPDVDEIKHRAGVQGGKVRQKLFQRPGVIGPVTQKADPVRFPQQLVEKAFSLLTPIQQSCVKQHIFGKKSFAKIAASEGKAKNTIQESYDAAIKKMKKFLKNTLPKDTPYSE